MLLDRDEYRELRVHPSRRSVTFGIRGILTLWSCWAGTMLVVFLVGMSIGKQRGATSALEEFGQEPVRIPLPSTASERPSREGETAAPAAQSADTVSLMLSGGANLPLSSQSALSLSSSAAASSALPLASSAMSAGPGAAITPGNLFSTERVETDIVKHATEPARTDQPDSASVPTPQNARWIVKAATFRKKQEALAAEKRIRQLKMPVVIEASEGDGARYYRLILGPFASEQKATAARKQALRAKIVKGELYVKQLAPQ